LAVFAQMKNDPKEDDCELFVSATACIAFIPALVIGIEELFSSKSGAEKKDAAMSFLQNALAMTDAISSREIVDPEKFRDGISRIIDGTVECLNA
jgi:hypothetical protein